MLNLTKDEINARIAKYIAALFNEAEDITVINLGVGMPTQVSNYITNEKTKININIIKSIIHINIHKNNINI